MGAWIEMFFNWAVERGILVASFMGAWIEISTKRSNRTSPRPSHPSWVRGLKYELIEALRVYLWSHPSWVRGLKLFCTKFVPSAIVSHPSWVRGLKSNIYFVVHFVIASHPSWMRGFLFDEFKKVPSLCR